jgi:hypothetical protein
MHPNNDEERTAYNFAFGALHSLASAKQLGYPDTEPVPGTSEKRTAEVQAIAKRMAEDDCFVTKGDWLAGFYYNDALLRCDIGYEHLLRYWTNLRAGERDDTIIVRAQIAKFPADLILPWWTEVSNQVNILKHKLQPPHGPVEVLPPQAFQILDRLIQAVGWAIENRSLRP